MRRLNRHRPGALWFALLAGAAGLAACSDTVVAPADITPQFAKPAPPPGTGASQWTIPSSGIDLFGDARGAYVNGVCGVSAAIGVNPSTGNLLATLALPTSSKGLSGSCLPLRAATVRLAVRHIGYDALGNDIDDAGSPIGDVGTGSIKIGETGAGVVNTNACLRLQRNGSYAGVGMRFQSATYPGSNDLIVTQNGPGDWHVATQPYPNNIGYCEGDAGISYWHVVIDLNIAPQ